MSLTLHQILTQRKLLCLFLLGFASGLPFIILLSAIPAWLTQLELSLSTIGSLTLLRTPYAYKFLWAPLLDRYTLPGLGRRKGWLLLTQLLCGFSIISLALVDPTQHFALLMGLAALLAFVSATQDIVSSAYLTDTSNETPDLRGLSAVSYTTGYRVAVLTAGAGAMLASQFVGWTLTLIALGAMMSIGLIATLLAPATKLEHITEVDVPNLLTQLKQAINMPIKQKGGYGALILVCLVVLTYKMGDALALSLNTPFLYRTLNFTMTEIAFASKTIGLIATIAGGVLGGFLMTRLSLYQALFYFGWAQCLSTLTYAWLAWVGHDYAVMLCAVSTEFFMGGLGTSAFMAFMMSQCCEKHSATQYALLSGLSAMPNIYGGPLASHLVETMGWFDFYLLCTGLALPGIALVWLMNKKQWLS